MKKKVVVKKVSPKQSQGDKMGISSKITPLFDRVVLKPLSEEEVSKTSSGIIIPDTVSKEKPEQGIVVAVGLGKWDDGVLVPMNVKVGDKVVFSRYGYDEVKLDGVLYYILREENILAVIK